MEGLSEFVVAVFIVSGGVFGLVGSFGLIKLRETMQRLHGPTKATTLGIGCVLVASMLYFLLIKGNASFHELLITLFLFLTAPITANFVAKTYLIANPEGEELPDSNSECGWSIFDDPPNAKED